jgi:alpha-1,3-rhamnosyl/mannosyltransferase
LEWAIRVWQHVNDPNLGLVLCGLQAPNETPWLNAVPPERRGRVLPLQFVEESDMPGLYGAAQGVLYPTLYEGFGFPAIEGLATGTPVLMSAVGSLEELVGPGTLILPPDDLAAWVAAVNAVAALKEKTKGLSRIWARNFDWPTAWKELQVVYEDAAQMRHRR